MNGQNIPQYNKKYNIHILLLNLLKLSFLNKNCNREGYGLTTKAQTDIWIQTNMIITSASIVHYFGTIGVFRVVFFAY